MMALGQGISALSGLFGARKARKEKRRAEKKQRKDDKLTNLINILGGRGSAGVTADSGVPSVGVSDALQALGQIGAGIAGVAHQDDYRMTAEQAMALEREKIEAMKQRSSNGLPPPSGSHNQYQALQGGTDKYIRDRGVPMRHGVVQTLEDQLRQAGRMLTANPADLYLTDALSRIAGK